MEFICIKDKNLLILGMPGSGKTTLAKHLLDSEHQLISTDYFVNNDIFLATASCLSAIQLARKKVIVEGMLGYNLLKEGFRPDIVIELEISEEKQTKIYKKERDPKKIKFLKSFFQGKQTLIKNLNLKDIIWKKTCLVK